MNRGRRTLTALCAIAMLAAACGNSPGQDGAEPAPDTAAPATTAPNTPDGASDPEPTGTAEPVPDTAEPVPDTAEPAPDTASEVPAPGTEGEAPEPEESTTTEPVVEEPADPYPRRHEFVALEGVPGVSDDEIRVAVVGTGAVNPLGTCVLDCYITGIQSYFDYINGAGGVYGRRLVIGEVLDDGLLRSQEQALKLISDDNSLAAFQASLVASGWGDLNDAGIPAFVWAGNGTETVNRDAIYGHVAIGCATCSERGLPWLISQAGATRVALLGYGASDASKVCAKTLSDSVTLYQADLGIEVAYFNDTLTFGLPNGIGPEVTQMIDAGVDFIATCLDLNAMLTLAQELERQGVRDQVSMYHPNSYDHEFVEAAGDLFDGDYVRVLFVPFEYEIESPLRRSYDQWVPASGGPVSEQTMIGWINADLFVTGLLEAGPSFDRRSIIDSLNLITYSAGGMINPVDWSRQHTAVVEGVPDHDYELECVSFVRMEGGAFVGFQPAPWMCWPNSHEEWVEPTPTDFTG